MSQWSPNHLRADPPPRQAAPLRECIDTSSMGGFGRGASGFSRRASLGTPSTMCFQISTNCRRVDLTVNQHGKKAQDTVGKFQIALDLVHRGAVAAVIQPYVIPATFAFNWIGKVTESPFVGLNDLTATGSNDVFEPPNGLFLD